MTEEEFQRLKEVEKRHLREKKRMREALDALKKRNRAQSVLQKMKQGAQRVLRETESLVDTLRSQVARDEVRLEVAIDEDESIDDLHDAEEQLREERAESLVRQYKAASSPAASRPATEEQESPDEASSSSDGPEKTIGRMRTSRSGEEST